MSLKKDDRVAIVSYLKNEFEFSFEEVYSLDDLDRNDEEFPAEWKQLSNDQKHNIQVLWSGAKPFLPKFISLLTNSLLDIFFGKGELGFTMIYYLENWREFDFEEYVDGFMVAGSPIGKETIDVFESEIGFLPESLRSLWRVHAYIVLRNESVLATLQSKAFDWFGIMKNIGLRTLSNEENGVYECLTIIDSWKQLPWCLTRKEGDVKWNDSLKIVERDGKEIISYAEYDLDSLLIKGP